MLARVVVKPRREDRRGKNQSTKYDLVDFPITLLPLIPFNENFPAPTYLRHRPEGCAINSKKNERSEV